MLADKSAGIWTKHTLWLLLLL